MRILLICPVVPKTYGGSKRRKIVIFGASIYRVSEGGQEGLGPCQPWIVKFYIFLFIL